MNYIHHLNTFLWLLQRESRLTSNHISLYLALFHHWNCNRFQHPFPLYRERLMQISGIGSKNTYLKCLKELHQYGYIRYDPSLHRHHRPKVSLLRWKVMAEAKQQLSIFQTNLPENKPLTVTDMGQLIARIGTLSDPEPVKPRVKSEPDSVPDVGPNNKEGPNVNGGESEAHSQDFSVKDPSGGNANRATSRAAASPAARSPVLSLPPSREEVLQYFATIKHSEKEASGFFSHYQANGWLLGGKVPIKNWQAAADKWVNNSFANKNYSENKNNQYAGTKSTQRPGHLDVNQDKDYDDPL